MRKTLVLLALFAALLTGCKKSSAPAAPAASNTPADAVQKKMQELAGSGATDCGRYKSQAADQMKIASDCALKAAQGKRPFYVAYDLPGLTVGMAGNGEGKLFTLQAPEPDQARPGATAEVMSAPCPAELRIAQSGRVTCVAPGTVGMGGTGGHGGTMPMPAAGGQNPHGAMPMPPAGTPNPHGGKTPPKQP